MKNLISICVSLLLLTMLSVGCAKQPPAEESCNFVQNQYDRRVSWARMPVRFYADDSISNEQILGIERAMEVWNNHFDEPVFELIGRTQELPAPVLNGQGRVVADGYNGIYISDASMFENSSTKDEQARTSIGFRGDFIYEADILIDSSENFFYETHEIRSSQAKINFDSLLIHELGHVLGLEHIEEPGSVMNPKLQYGEYRVEIGEADFASLACEYQ